MRLRIPILLATLIALVGSAAWAETAPDASGLFVDCRGERTASPTVILESGAFGTSADWDRVLTDLSAKGRVCAYDRAGVGDSPPRSGGEGVAPIAQELAALLDRLGETRPVILVGHSNGALYVETFAAMYPSRVAGLVYVNGVTSNDIDDPVLLRYLSEERCLSNLAAFAGELGLAPLVAPIVVGAEGLSREAAKRKRRALTRVHSLIVARDEDRAITPGLAVTQNLGGAPARIPVVVIVGETYPDAFSSREWTAAETLAAARAERAWILKADGATHVSPLSRDRAYVIAGVDWLRSLALPGPDVGH